MAGKNQKPQNRKQRKELARRLSSDNPGLDVVHPEAAGIDVGNSVHYVAVRPDRDAEGQPVRRFECFTADLQRMAQWLVSCGVRTVAMQSTGVYWIPILEILEAHGLEVWLVNARHTRNLPGRKSDVQECQWLLKLHTYGLLRNSFQPPSEIRVMRTYWRQRRDHIESASRCVQRMQKALAQMNLQLANVISDVSGVSGMCILRAILEGERDPDKLAGLCDFRVKASREEVAKSLHGNWRADLLFVLKQEVKMYDSYQERLRECDRELEDHLKSLSDRTPPDSDGALKSDPPPGKRKRTAERHMPHFNLGSELQRISGADLTRINGIDVLTAQTVISEAGFDMERWKTEAHFASWLGLCPNNSMSGDRTLGRSTRRVVNRAATALRIAATTLLRSPSYLGAQYRRLRARLGAPKAITAMAHKLARLIYRMLKYGDAYVDQGAEYYENNYRDQQMRHLKKNAAKLGLDLVPIAPA